MSLQQRIHSYVFDNPIAWRETVTLQRSRSKWYWRVMIGGTLLLLCLPILWGFNDPFYQHLNIIVSIQIIVNVLLYPLVVVRTITTASNSVHQERSGRTWELLLLTGVGTWRLLLGKWLGVMRFMWRDYLWMFLLRAGTLLWAVAAQNLDVTYTYRQLYGWDGHVAPTLANVNFGHESLLLILGVMAVYVVLELLLSSALGVGFAMFGWRKRMGSSIALAVRVAVPIALVLGMLFSLGYFGPHYVRVDLSQQAEALLFSTVGSLGENGGLLSLMWLDDYISRDIGSALALGHVLGVLPYLLLTSGALKLGHYAGLRQGGARLEGGTGKAKRKRPTQATQSVIAEAVPSTRTLHVTPGMDNALQLAEPQSYRAEVYHYQRRLGHLYLRLSGDGELRYGLFTGVTYLEAPVQWRGAQFRAAPQDEYERFIAEKGLHINALQAETMRLYVLEGRAAVRIVAASVQLLDELPAHV